MPSTFLLDLLVNNLWGGYENRVEDGRFTWPDPYWEQPAWRWDAMMNVGVRAAFVASQLATRSMLGGRGGTGITQHQRDLVISGSGAH